MNPASTRLHWRGVLATAALTGVVLYAAFNLQASPRPRQAVPECLAPRDGETVLLIASVEHGQLILRCTGARAKR